MIDILTEELTAIRAKIGVIQEEFSNIIGISGQTTVL
jgi:DNA-binding XRE family transcriptional regulator